ncbi:MAG: phosphoribosylglycinamide formyltransferase [Gammaproteobacteria bacterium]|nr:MAG: phosphoribosylglycinamide formyltransferase [Gammaproteobacteria bacterium]
MNKQKLKIAVLVSGNGSNLQVLIDAQKTAELPIEIVGIISNKEDAYAIKRANKAAINIAVLSHTSSGKRMKISTFEQHALNQLKKWQPDLIVLAGFMRVLSAGFINACPAPMINLHPSLLPKFKGLNTHARAIDNHEVYHGCSVHVVTAELDAGTVIAQAILKIKTSDTAATLQNRVHELEYKLLPWVVHLIAKGMFANDNQKVDFSQLATPECLPALPWKLAFFE